MLETVGGDGRCDSPGHCAKYGTYSLLELSCNRIIDFKLVQVYCKVVIIDHVAQDFYPCRVMRSAEAIYHMEKEGLSRAIQHMKDKGLAIEVLVIDRHKQIAKWIREKHPEIKHYFDVWHVAKGMKMLLFQCL